MRAPPDPHPASRADQAPDASTGSDAERAPLVGRVLVVGLIVALLGAAWTDAEWWPISSMRLFSGLRTGEVVAYEVYAIDADGAEHRVQVAALGRSFRGAHHLIPTLGGRPEAERDAVCGAWADALVAAGGPTAVEMRIDRVVRSVPTTDDGRAVELRRTVRTTCRGIG